MVGNLPRTIARDITRETTGNTRPWRILCCVALLLASIVGAPVSADIAIDWVPIGDAGNTPDLTGYGSVPYDYHMGKYEVTIGQYTAFLNAVAASDPHRLYSQVMPVDICGILRSGVDGSYTYEVVPGRENKPVMYVSILSAARFANWLHNGQPTGPQTTNTTENGAYMLNGATDPQTYLMTRRPGATVFLPSENEWYKAAYYKGCGLSTGYWDYATGSNTAPTGGPPPGGTNSANYDRDYYERDVTDVGAYELSPSPYGTFDQNGNLLEYNESWMFDWQGYWYGTRGGNYWDESPTAMHASARSFNRAGGSSALGFRVATLIPEPCVLSLLLVAGLLKRPRRR